jgi:hypothetical protein
MRSKFSLVGRTKYTAGTSGMDSRSEWSMRCKVTPRERREETLRRGEMMERVWVS